MHFQTLIGAIFALAALVANGQPLDSEYAQNAFTYGTPRVTQDFAGLEWDCDGAVLVPGVPTENETCYAGVRIEGTEARPVTGP